MKTMTLKNAFKLLLFLLILFSAKAFSLPRLPNDASSSGTVSRIGPINKVMTFTKSSSNGYSTVTKSNALLSKNNKRFKK